MLAWIALTVLIGAVRRDLREGGASAGPRSQPACRILVDMTWAH